MVLGFYFQKYKKKKLNFFSKTHKQESFFIFKPDGGKIKAAKVTEEKKYDKIYFYTENCKKKMEWMFSIRLNSTPSPSYEIN